MVTAGLAVLCFEMAELIEIERMGYSLWVRSCRTAFVHYLGMLVLHVLWLMVETQCPVCLEFHSTQVEIQHLGQFASLLDSEAHLLALAVTKLVVDSLPAL